MFESHCGGVRVTVMRPDEKTGLKTGLKRENESMDQMIKRIIEENPVITIPMLSEATGLSRNGVLYHLQVLKEKMGLIRVGGRKNGYWEFHAD